MNTFSIYSVSAINLFILSRYTYLIVKKKINPALAMWIFFTLAVAMSLATYIKSGNYNLQDNILNSTDLIMVSLISFVIYFFGDSQTRFNLFDKLLLGVVVLIIIFWIFSHEHIISNLLIQAILVIAYIPVIARMFKSRSNQEPFSVWIALMLAPALALISSKGQLASIYAIRAIFCTGILLILMIRIEVKYNAGKIKN